MDHSLPGIPPTASRRQPQPNTNKFTQGHSPAATRQDLYPTPHQDVPPGSHSVITPSPHSHYPSPPPFTHRASYAAGPQYPLPHAPPHMVHLSPPFGFPHHPGTPGQETSMHNLAYSSSTLMPMLPHPYQGPFADPTPSPHQTSTPPSHSPLTRRRASMATPSEARRPTLYPSRGTYPAVGYAIPQPFIYPPRTSFVPASSIYGSHHHYGRPYGSPLLQENQGSWWFSGATATASSLNDLRPRSQSQFNSDYPMPVQQRHEIEQPRQRRVTSPPDPSPTGKYASRSHFGNPIGPRIENMEASLPSSSTPASQTKSTQNPLSSERRLSLHHERRSYHPKSPADRSEWVMWAGNVPSDATSDELRDFFNRPLPPQSPNQLGTPTKPLQVHGGVSSVFLIARSNCAFVNFESEAHLETATARFNGHPVRPDDPRCPRLVCRVRNSLADLKAGVGAQRGNGMHAKWVKEQRARARDKGADSMGFLEGIEISSSHFPISTVDDEVGSSASYSSSSGSLTSTDSDILSRYFPQRYFILKSLTEHDLDLSVRRNIWATQPHNEEILDRAYRTSKDVFLIFGVNKSGEFYGYARMAGPFLHSDDRVPWASYPASALPLRVPTVSDVRGSASPESTVERHQVPRSIFPPEEHRVVEQSPESVSHAIEGPSIVKVRASSAPPRLFEPHRSMGQPRASIPLNSLPLDLNTDAPHHAMRNTSSDQSVHQIPVHAQDAVLQTEPARDSDEPKGDLEQVWGRPFRVDWIHTEHLPFLRTRHLRNPWNHGREVKVSRDGTEVEPSVGRQLLEEWDKFPLADVPAAPSHAAPRHRRSKSTQYAPCISLHQEKPQ